MFPYFIIMNIEVSIFNYLKKYLKTLPECGQYQQTKFANKVTNKCSSNQKIQVKIISLHSHQRKGSKRWTINLKKYIDFILFKHKNFTLNLWGLIKVFIATWMVKISR